MFVLISRHKLQNGSNLPKLATTQSSPSLVGRPWAGMFNENEGRFGMSHVKTPGPSCKGQLHHNIKGNWSLCTHLSPFYGGYLCISHCTYYRCHIIDLGAVKGLLPITEFLTVCWWQLYRAGLGWGTMSFFIRKKSTNLFNLPYACNY